MKTNEHIKIGHMDIPIEYTSYDEELKNKFCDKIIDKLLYQIDKHINPNLDRIEFLDLIFKSSLMVNEENEEYEVCCVIRDCIKRLNED